MPTKKDDPYGAGAIAEELRPLYQLETVADNLGEIASALHTLAHATALRVIAEHGSDRDRKAMVENLKTWFEEFRES